MKSILALVAFIIFFYSEYLSATPVSQYQLELCNSCQTQGDYRNYAYNRGSPGDIIVFNLETYEAYTFRLRIQINQMFPDESFSSIHDLQTPNEAYSALAEAKSLEESFQYVLTNADWSNYASSSSSVVTTFANDSNGCGPSGDWLHRVIPNFPFGEACNVHDMCYSSTNAKDFCDQEFLARMKEVADSLKNLGGPIEGFLYKAVASRMADIYYAGVRNGMALERYCQYTNGPGLECDNGGKLPPTGLHYGIDEVEIGYTNAGGMLHASCEIWRFPDGNNSYYYITRNCSFYISR